MYCLRCRVHFSGSRGERRCPYCGDAAEDSKPAQVPAAGDGSRGTQARTRTETEDPSPWPPGSTVAGKYEVLERLGSGGFGTVYKVRHLQRKKYYALKTPHAEFLRDDMFRRRFEREIEAMERFVHPDAVMIRDSGVTGDGRPYYTMDFIAGESLKAVLRREEKLGLDRACRIAERVLRVLDVAHAHRIVHRDIKPDNILLARSGGRESVKVVDFGVAKLLDLVGESGSITRGARVGTPKYMSPEQITGEAVDERSDLFSLGMVFYEMLTGKHPFARGHDPIRITASILSREPEPPRDLEPDLPRALSDLVLSMIEKKPKRRPGSAAAVLEELAGLPRGDVRAGGAGPLRLVQGIARRKAAALVFRQETEAGERRAFVLFDERAAFGRSNDRAKGIVNQLLWRLLPCRSEAEDAENWRRNLTIAHRVGTIYPDGSTIVIEPQPASRHGVVIGGVRSHRAARISSDRFQLSLGEKALELDGHRLPAGPDGLDLDLAFLASGRPPGIEPPQLSGYSNPACRVDCASFFRANNHPLHEYHIVYRLLRIGSSPGATLAVRGRAVAGAHAAVLFEAGEALLLALEDGVTVRVAGGGGARSEMALPPWSLIPLAGGLDVRLGDAGFRVDDVDESDFKGV